MEGEECKEGDAFCFRHNPNSTASTSVSWPALPITSAYRVHQRTAFCPSFWLPQLVITMSNRIVEHNRSVPARNAAPTAPADFPQSSTKSGLRSVSEQIVLCAVHTCLQFLLTLTISSCFSSYLPHYQLAISSFEQENSSLLFSVRYLVYQLATCQLATELQYSAHLSCSSIFLSLSQNAALPLFGSPTMPHRLDGDTTASTPICDAAAGARSHKKKIITASTEPEHARSTPPKRYDYDIWIRAIGTA